MGRGGQERGSKKRMKSRPAIGDSKVAVAVVLGAHLQANRSGGSLEACRSQRRLEVCRKSLSHRPLSSTILRRPSGVLRRDRVAGGKRGRQEAGTV
jgi:hypothetical protein